MACYAPRAAFRPPTGGPLTFTYRKQHAPITIRCGNCIGCMIDDARDWATRCMHEARLHKHNCFLTLTYDQEHLPKDLNLDHRQFQLFIKRLREKATFPPAPKGGGSGGESQKTSTILTSNWQRNGAPVAPYEPMARPELRYHMCGEYGPTTGRPHYHANMFGLNFADRKPWKKTPAGSQLYKSETLDKIWANGQCSIGQLTWQTAAYTARYNMKKAGQKNKTTEIINPDTGEIHYRTAEYQKMSRNPGIGGKWIQQYKNDVYPRGTVIVNAHETTTPRYYDNYYKKLDEQAYNRLKLARQHEQAKRPVDITKSRQQAEEIVTRAKLAFLKRQGL